MGDRSTIEWTDATWNPIRGCTRVSEGCRHCYAERMAARFSGPNQPYEGLVAMTSAGPRWTRQVRFLGSMLDQPARWRRPRRIFVNSMSDLFHEALTFEQIAAAFGAMAAGPQHQFQVLTKRPARMRAWFEWFDTWIDRSRQFVVPQLIHRAATHIEPFAFTASERLYAAANRAAGRNDWPLPNVWLGVSVENQAAADERVPTLLDTSAALRWLSVEPLLGPVDLSPWRHSTPSIDWVVCGGESGPGARAMKIEWVRDLRDQCGAAGIPFLFKQWGAYVPGPDGPIRVGKKAAGRTLDGHVHDAYPRSATSHRRAS